MSLGMCLAIGSWSALFILIMGALFSRARILEEEKACIEQYGEAYRTYMKRVPRYIFVKTSLKEEVVKI
jgi:protein-S-isoprenylcysteine O-methyltransferase Ste14